MRVLTLARCVVREDARDAFIARFNAYRAEVLATEPGTLVFDLFAGCADPCTFLLDEQFADEAARQAHLDASSHAAAVADLRAFIVNGAAQSFVLSGP